MDATFTIEGITNKLRLTTKNGEYVLTGENVKEFPQVPPFKGSSSVTLENSVLKRIIHRTVFAVSTDELRPAMMGVLLQAKGSELRTVATDGHRLVKLSYRGAGSLDLKRDIVVPAKALLIVAKSIDAGESVISVSDTHVKVTFDSSTLVSRLIDETYPNYESVIPVENDKAMVVSREEMMASIRRVALYASATTHQVRFDVTSESLEITAQDIDFGGEAKETIKCSYTGDNLEIGFNSIYLIDILSHLESEQVQFKFSTPTRAGIVAPVTTGPQEEVLMLVMPVRLNA
jgi:DNA polymerase-3 subunit beta